MFRITATAGWMWRKESTYSQASQTMVSLWPTRELAPKRGSLPPMMALGSRPPSRKIWVSMAVVVVLPWVPDTATQRLKRLVSRPSISARSKVGMPFSRAATSSGLSFLQAAVYTTHWASPMFSALWPMATEIP